jgi:hypothetical protein
MEDAKPANDSTLFCAEDLSESGDIVEVEGYPEGKAIPAFEQNVVYRLRCDLDSNITRLIYVGTFASSTGSSGGQCRTLPPPWCCEGRGYAIDPWSMRGGWIEKTLRCSGHTP